MKSRSSLLVPAHPGGPGKRAVKWLWCGSGNAAGKIRNGMECLNTAIELRSELSGSLFHIFATLTVEGHKNTYTVILKNLKG